MDLKTVFLDLILEGTHGCKEVESSEKLLHALLITQIFLIFQRISNRSNRSIIGVIKDFWTFSEISSKSLDMKMNLG